MENIPSIHRSAVFVKTDFTALKMRFTVNDFFNKYEQRPRILWMPCVNLLNKCDSTRITNHKSAEILSLSFVSVCVVIKLLLFL